MRTEVAMLIRRTLLVAALAALGHAILVLATGGYTARVGSLWLHQGRATPWIMAALLLAGLGLLAGGTGRLSARAAAHAVPLFFFALLLIYLANGKTLSSGDTYAVRQLPLSILRDGNLDLDEFPFLQGQDMPDGPEIPYWLQHVRGRWVSRYPIGAALLAIPVYLPSALGGVDPQSPIIVECEKLAAALTVALAALVMLLTLRRMTFPWLAFVLATFYALGTSNLSVSSQAMWQHGPSQLGLACALYCLVRGRSPDARAGRWIALAGFPLAFAVTARPTDVIIAAVLGLYVIGMHIRQVPGFIAAGLPPVAFQLAYNVAYFGNPLRMQEEPNQRHFWQTPVLDGLLGILVSPGRGLLVYSPACMFTLLGFARSWAPGGDWLIRSLSIGTLATILLYAKWFVWWGGHTYGPRLLADLGPALTLGMVPLQDWLAGSRAARAALVALVLVSVVAHANGALRFSGAWDDYHGGDRARFWRWGDNELVGPSLQILDRVGLAVTGAATSRTAPDQVAATYRAISPTTLDLGPGRAIDLWVEARNAGRATWIAWDLPRRDMVVLGWRWRHAHDGAPAEGWPDAQGVRPLLRNVRPGESHTVRAVIKTPPAPGEYRLEVSLVLIPGTWLADHGSPALTIHATVR